MKRHRAGSTRPRVGRCIYCHSTEPPLTDEHIFPQGLRGRDFLRDASCEGCRIITGQIEQEVLRDAVWPLRQMLGMKGRRKQPPTIPTRRLDVAGNELHLRLPHHQIWTKAALPDFKNPPGFLSGRERSEGQMELDIVVFYDPRCVGGKYDPGGFVRVRPEAVARMLAKIAHAQAVKIYGLDGFDAYLPDVILGTDPSWQYFVGRPIQDDTDPPVGTSNWIRLYHHPDINSGIVLGRIQLFQEVGGPVYDIVIGRPKPPV